MRQGAPPRPAPRPSPARRPHRWGLRLGIAALFVAALGGTGYAAQARFLPEALVLPGLRIDGEPIPEGADLAGVRAVAERRAQARLDRKVRLVLPGSDAPVLEGTLAELGVTADLDATVAAATRAGKSGDLLGRVEQARAAREGAFDVPLFTSVDHDRALPRLVALKEEHDLQPVSARLDLDAHATIPEKPGRYIDADGALSALQQIARDPVAYAREHEKDGALVLELPVASFAPRISSAFLKSLDVSAVVAEYETYFSRSGEQSKRGKNIDNAARRIDGIVLSPGELVSFNEIVGERSEANGFFKSWEIFKGEMVEGVGGGTCQVASTFHAVAFFGGLEVLERLPHSRPSAYIPMGLDSTVVYPAVDLKVRNPHPFPVVVHAKTQGNKLRVELLGKMRPTRVTFRRELLETIPYKRKIVEEPMLAGRKVRVKQHGINGFRIKRIREMFYPDGTRRKEETKDFYPATTEIYEVPVGFDVALLPPLPGGDAEDPDLGGNPSPAPPSARAPAGEGTDATASAATPVPFVEFEEAPGAHAPTNAQANPAKTMTLRR